jgi:hypothetical protein
VGAIRPRIVLPEAFAAREDDVGLRLALAHEGAHIANGDLWFLAVARVLDLVLVAHPLYWWVRRCVRRDQELLADARACAVSDRCTYAERLVRWARAGALARGLPMAGVVALWGRHRCGLLRERVVRLLDDSRGLEAGCPGSWRWGARGMAVVLLGAIVIGSGQRAPGAAAGVGETTQGAAAVVEERLLELVGCAPRPPKAGVWGCPPDAHVN